jgi:hypothetical protein
MDLSTDSWNSLNYQVKFNKKTFRLSNKTNRPHIQVRFSPETTAIDALIDTGSKHNLISLELFHQIQRNLKRNLDPKRTNLKLVSHTRDPIEILGQIEIDLWIKDIKNNSQQFQNIEFIVTNDVTEEQRILLGTQFLTQFKCDLTFLVETQTMTTRGLQDKPNEDKIEETEDMIGLHIYITTTI